MIADEHRVILANSASLMSVGTNTNTRLNIRKEEHGSTISWYDWGEIRLSTNKTSPTAIKTIKAIVFKRRVVIE
jgi:hypothetical protein